MSNNKYPFDFDVLSDKKMGYSWTQRRLSHKRNNTIVTQQKWDNHGIQNGGCMENNENYRIR